MGLSHQPFYFIFYSFFLFFTYFLVCVLLDVLFGANSGVSRDLLFILSNPFFNKSSFLNFDATRLCTQIIVWVLLGFELLYLFGASVTGDFFTETLFSSIRITYAGLWSWTYLALLGYIIFIFSVLWYTWAQALQTPNELVVSRRPGIDESRFVYLPGLLVWPVLSTPLVLTLLVAGVWSGPAVSGWFGHLIFAGFQAKVAYVIIILFMLTWLAYSTSFYFTSVEVYDYTIVTYSFLIWTLFLFTANNIFTVIFFIEILATLVTLLFITSVFSSTYFYNTLSLSRHSYFNQSTPLAFVQTLLFFFWISLIASLNLFLFFILFYLKFATTEWYTLEILTFFIFSISNLHEMFSIALIWLNFMFCIFLKCGLVPFYFWKPTFFKGISLYTLFFYTFFYYFAVLYFFIYFTLVYVSDLFYANIFINNILLMVGALMLVFILCESYYLKAFFALSSILNTLFVFLMMSSYLIIEGGCFCIGG